MNSRTRIIMTLVAAYLMCAMNLVEAKELSAKEHLEIGKNLIDKSRTNTSKQNPELHSAIQHIKTAITLGLNYEEKAQADLLIATYASGNLTAKEHFEMGKSLIEANNYDSHGATQSGMVEGMRQMREAIRLNYSELKSAYLVLANAYDQWPEQPKENSEAEKLRISERSQVLRRLYQLYPDDLEVMDLYASRTSDRKEKILVYGRMLELNPKLPDPHFMLGFLYIKDGKFGAGIAESKRYIELESDQTVISDRASMIASALIEQNCTVPGDDEWGNIDVERGGDIGTQSKEEVSRARLRIAKIKKNFLIALEKVICPAIK